MLARCSPALRKLERLAIENRGRVIGAINRRPLARLSKLLSILKQNAFLRFIIAGVMTWSLRARSPPFPRVPFPLQTRLSTAVVYCRACDHHLRRTPCLDLLLARSPVATTRAAVVNDHVDDRGHVPEPYRAYAPSRVTPRIYRDRVEISILRQRRMFHVPWKIEEIVVA